MNIDLTSRKKQLEEEIEKSIHSFIEDTGLMDIEVDISTSTYECLDKKGLVSIDIELKVLL